jgi:WD40 repeat protein
VPAVIGTAQAIDDAVATASHDGSARLWEVQYPTAAPAVLRGHEDGVTAVAFSADGRWLATASSDSSARLWAVSADLLIEKACRVAGVNAGIKFPKSAGIVFPRSNVLVVSLGPPSGVG